MQESRALFKIIIVVLFLGISKVSAQNKYLDFFVGATVNISENTDFIEKYSLDRLKVGLNVGASFSQSFCENMFRYGGDILYNSKGEKYSLGDSINFDSDISYFQIRPFIKYYIPSAPLYIGVGFYGAYAVNKVVNYGDDFKPEIPQIDQPTPKYYSAMDFGPTLWFGGELNFGAVSYFAGICLEYGLANISERENRKIFNRSAEICVGVNFLITDKNYRH